MDVLDYISIASGIAAIVVCRLIAIKKGRSVGGWATLGFFFGWIAVIILACLKPLNTPYVPAPQPNLAYTCTQCHRMINSLNCLYCGHVHTEEELPPPLRPYYFGNGGIQNVPYQGQQNAPAITCVHCKSQIHALSCPNCGHVHTEEEIPAYLRTYYFKPVFTNAPENDRKWHCTCGTVNHSSARECTSCFRPKPQDK